MHDITHENCIYNFIKSGYLIFKNGVNILILMRRSILDRLKVILIKEVHQIHSFIHSFEKVG